MGNTHTVARVWSRHEGLVPVSGEKVPCLSDGGRYSLQLPLLPTHTLTCTVSATTHTQHNTLTCTESPVAVVYTQVYDGLYAAFYSVLDQGCFIY